MSRSVLIPPGLDSQRALGDEWATWLDLLPMMAEGLLEEWSLVLDGEAMHGHCSLVLPVRTGSGEAAVLKIGLPDRESEHEHLALQRWAGMGAVRLLRADPRRRAMLLDHLSTRSLVGEWDLAACELVGERYAALHVPAGPQYRSLSAGTARWRTQLRHLPRDAPIPRRMVEQAISLTGQFGTDPGTDGTLIHTDLHYGNVLHSFEEPGTWVVIDPKPLSGDPHYEPAPMLWNRFEELAGDVRDGVRRRFHTLIDTAGLDEDRARDWVIVRMVMNACWALAGDPTARAAETRRWVTTCISVTKAVQE